MKRIVALFMALIFAVSSLTIGANAAESAPLNKEPFIFVHGLNGWGKDEGINRVLPYWGATTGDLMQYLTGEGYECYSCSVGPMNSSWDRACELYAELTGTTVDYGEAHAARHKHSRYGRAYTKALVPNWGTNGENGVRKVHLIGHSFGGTTVRTLVQLLADGSAEERAKTSPESLSPLFQGGKSDWVKSVTTLCTPHNSSTLYYPLHQTHVLELVIFASFLYAICAGRSDVLARYVDFHLEQFGMTDEPGKKNAVSLVKAVQWIFSSSEDFAHNDLLPQNAVKINEWLDINPNVYYFSYAYSTTKQLGKTNINLPIARTNPVLLASTVLMGIMPSFTDKESGYEIGLDSRVNDGLVSLPSALYPWDEPHRTFDQSRIEKGIWQVMPIRTGDHGTAIGLFADKDTTHALYDEIAQRLVSLPD